MMDVVDCDHDDDVFEAAVSFKAVLSFTPLLNSLDRSLADFAIWLLYDRLPRQLQLILRPLHAPLRSELS